MNKMKKYLAPPGLLHRLLEYLFTVSGFNESIDSLLVIELQNEYRRYVADFKCCMQGRLTSSSGLLPVTERRTRALDSKK